MGNFVRHLLFFGCFFQFYIGNLFDVIKMKKNTEIFVLKLNFTIILGYIFG